MRRFVAANLTRRDGDEFLALAPNVPVRTTVETYPLADANRALADLRGRELSHDSRGVPARSPRVR